MHATNDLHAHAAVTRGLSLAGLHVHPDRIATMVERVVTMLQTVSMFRGRLANRYSIVSPSEPEMLTAAVKQFVNEVRHGDVDLSGAHVSPPTILPGHVDCPDCYGMGIVRVEALGRGAVFTTCDCADPHTMMGDDGDVWEMPPWQVAALSHRATMLALDEACASTQRRPEPMEATA